VDSPDDGEQTPAQSPSLKSALDSMISSIFTPLSAAPVVDAERDVSEKSAWKKLSTDR
jgi:hypothetical protein